ncbi:hypothetical protein CKO15_04200 [Halorhodospira abdelmalekii]|nr:hypothetical protein [Halorhodospira abdelmalekii]
MPLGLLLALHGCYVPPDDGYARSGEGARGGEQATEGEETEERPIGWWEDEAQAAEESGRGGGLWGGGGESDQDRLNRLAREARQAYEVGDYRRASDRLEEALQIDPGHAVLLQKLAAVRFEQRRYQQAEGLALRAAQAAGGDRVLLEESWWLVAAARLERGNTPGAREAAQRARMAAGEPAAGAGWGREGVVPQQPRGGMPY